MYDAILHVIIAGMSKQSKTAQETYIQKQKPVFVLITETHKGIECHSFENHFGVSSCRQRRCCSAVS